MIFPHQDKEFSQLLRIVAEARRLAVGLVEKDYWVTHTLWALHQGSDLEVWFKGGTSLSKGFSLIHRFSEDLDLRIDSVSAGVGNTAWPKKPSAAQIKERVKYFTALPAQLSVADTTVTTMALDPDGRGADYKVEYPGQFVDTVVAPNSPFVKLEVARALVTPWVDRPIRSFVHEYLSERDRLKDYADNQASAVRCIHPRVTLIEKLDAIAARFNKNREPSEYIRHYEDAARIIQAERTLPALQQSLQDTAKEMAPSLRLKRVAPSSHPSLSDAPPNATELQRAYEAIAPMFWAPRLTLDESREIIRAWLKRNFE